MVAEGKYILVLASFAGARTSKPTQVLNHAGRAVLSDSVPSTYEKRESECTIARCTTWARCEPIWGKTFEDRISLTSCWMHTPAKSELGCLSISREAQVVLKHTLVHSVTTDAAYAASCWAEESDAADEVVFLLNARHYFDGPITVEQIRNGSTMLLIFALATANSSSR